MLEQAKDFGDESEALYELISPLSESALDEPTQFKNWTPNDVLQHLHFFNVMADLSLNDEKTFEKRYAILREKRERMGSLVRATDEMLDGLKGHALRDAWRDFYRDMANRWVGADPKQRVKWAGPSMSVRSSISARLMETWAHAQAIYDQRGVERVNGDRIKSIVVLGVNTYEWTFRNRGEEPPGERPYLRLTAPSGSVWEWGAPSTENRIEGSAAEFCQVVTQVRNIGDANLHLTGPAANAWLAKAQCFAGQPQDPPAPGTRFRQDP